MEKGWDQWVIALVQVISCLNLLCQQLEYTLEMSNYSWKTEVKRSCKEMRSTVIEQLIQQHCFTLCKLKFNQLKRPSSPIFRTWEFLELGIWAKKQKSVCFEDIKSQWMTFFDAQKVTNSYTHQRLKCFDFFNFISTQVEVIELRAAMKKV